MDKGLRWKKKKPREKTDFGRTTPTLSHDHARNKIWGGASAEDFYPHWPFTLIKGKYLKKKKLDTRKIAVIILKFEKCSFTINS